MARPEVIQTVQPEPEPKGNMKLGQDNQQMNEVENRAKE